MIKKLRNQGFHPTDPPKFFENNIFVSYRRKDDSVGTETKKKHTFEEKMKIVIEGQGSNILLEEICAREQISILTFHQWTKDFLDLNNLDTRTSDSKIKKLSEVEKFKIVIEGKSGETSIAEICRREKITQEIFLEWSASFLNLRKRKLEQYDEVKNLILHQNKELVSNRSNQSVFRYLENYVDFASRKTIIVLKENSARLDIIDNFENVVNLHKINDVRYINKYFEKVNSKLDIGGVFTGCFETLRGRRKRKKINNIPVLNNIYFAFEFIVKRILPKVSFTKKHYFDITKGNDRLLSKAEGLGRLVSCGFNIMDFKTIDGLLYFVVKKVSEPNFDLNPSYGPLYKMPRIGKNGKMIGVYKFRTMHPYSEYLQDFIVKVNGYSETGKPANDFRIPKWGKFMRRFWLDELPQLFNVLKGELKIVGIRPVSQGYFNDIPKEMQKLRITQLPGCIPPYVALNRAGNVMSVLQAEKEYLEEKIRNPNTTDIKYFIQAVYNIIIRHKRSA